MASHGRGFWVLVNIASLRQAEPGLTDRDLVLLLPASAYRSANWRGPVVVAEGGA